MYSINIIRDRMCVCVLCGYPACAPRLPRVSPQPHRCQASRGFVFRDRPAVAAAATFSRPSAECRPSSSPPLLHRWRSAKHTEWSNINIVFSIMYSAAVAYHVGPVRSLR